MESGDKALQLLESVRGILTVGHAAALSVSLFALIGCVSAVADSDAIDPLNSQQTAQLQAAESPKESAAPDGQVPVLDSATSARPAGASAEAGGDGAAMQPGLTMQSTALDATSASIYGQAPTASPGAAPIDGNQATGTTTGSGGQPAMNATTNSLFGTGQPAAPIIPQQGASNGAPATEETAAAASAVPATAAGNDSPSAVPLPLSAEAARAGAASPPLQPVASAAGDEPGSPPQAAAHSADSGESGREKRTLANLFAPNRKERSRGDAEREAQASGRKTITVENASEPQVASLAYTALPGVKMNPLFSMEQEAHEDDAPVEVASLSGLARLAPNGLVLQTETVETGCFKPALLEMLKTVERHYGRKVMVTSGLRPIKVNSKRQSLHTRCEAADIQVQGVGKWELADFLRSIPGRGGVGTYCHTESVHIDVGPQRDWNWRCRRRKG